MGLLSLAIWTPIFFGVVLLALGRDEHARAVLADDERLMRDQLRARLAEVWPELQIADEAKNGLEAVEMVAQHRPEVVFLDIRMPGMTGVAFLKLVRERWPEVARTAEALLAAHGLMPIQAAGDLLGLDSYLRFLPGNFLPHHDRRARRSYLQFSYDLASLLPLYGRARGTGHGIAFWNRGGEPLQFDPLNKDDRTKNAHLLLLGPTGAGKSVLLSFLALQWRRFAGSKVFVFDKGGSARAAQLL